MHLLILLTDHIVILLLFYFCCAGGSLCIPLTIVCSPYGAHLLLASVLGGRVTLRGLNQLPVEVLSDTPSPLASS
jgi:hypothetical protein